MGLWDDTMDWFGDRKASDLMYLNALTLPYELLSEDQKSRVPFVGRFAESDAARQKQAAMQSAEQRYAAMREFMPQAYADAAKRRAGAYNNSANYLSEITGGKYKKPNFDDLYQNPMKGFDTNADPNAKKVG